jgi:hypothetical protein
MDETFQRFTVNRTEKERSVSATTHVAVDPVTAEELTQATKYSKGNKAAGYYGINIELIKHEPAPLHYGSLDLLNICCRIGFILEDWDVAIVMPIRGIQKRKKIVKIIEVLAFYVQHTNYMPKTLEAESRINVRSEPFH